MMMKATAACSYSSNSLIIDSLWSLIRYKLNSDISSRYTQVLCSILLCALCVGVCILLYATSQRQHLQNRVCWILKFVVEIYTDMNLRLTLGSYWRCSPKRDIAWACQQRLGLASVCLHLLSKTQRFIARRLQTRRGREKELEFFFSIKTGPYF